MPGKDLLQPGLYESPITRRIEDALAALGELAETAPIEPADAHVVLTRHLAKYIAASLQAAPDLTAKLVLANAILGSVRELTQDKQDLAGEAITISLYRLDIYGLFYRLAANPALSAEPCPPLGLNTGRMRRSYDAIISREPSVEPSSTAITSTFGYVCASALSIAARR